MARRLLWLLVVLALYGTAQCSEDYGSEDPPEDGEPDYPEGGEDEEPPPPPPPGDVKELLSVADFDSFLEDADDASVVLTVTAKEVIDPKAKMPDGWDADEDGEWEAPVIKNPTLADFESISASAYGFRYAFSSAPEVLAKLKSKNGGLFLYKSPKYVSKEHGDRLRERFPSDKLSESAVTNWLNAKSQPLVGPFTHTTKDRYKKDVLIIFMNLDAAKNSKSVQYVLKRARKAAVALKGKLAIAVADLTEMSYDMEQDYGLKAKSTHSDILMGIRSAKSDYYASTADKFSALALTSFADAFLGGELTPYVKPDPPPSPPYDEDDAGESAEDDDMPEDSEGAEAGDKEEM